MSIGDLKEALRLIAENPSMGFFAGPRDPALVVLAERALGGNFPPTYREFVNKLGAGSFGSFEVYGVVDNEFYESPVPNGVWITLNERELSNFPDNAIIIGAVGDGNYYCIDHSVGVDVPVFIYREYARSGDKRENVARDFGEFLLNGIRSEIQVN